MTEGKKIRKKELFFLFVLVIFYVFINFRFLFIPLYETEYKLCKIVNAIKNGWLPYKNIDDNTPPLNYYIYITAQKIFNHSTEEGSLRFFTISYIIFFILLLYMMGRLMEGKTVAMLSTFFYVILMWRNPYNGLYSLPGLFAQFPLFLSLLFLIFIEEDYERVDYFLSGFFLSVASYIIFSLKFIIFIPIIYIFLLWKKQCDKLKYILWFIAGFTFMELLAFLWSMKNSMIKEFIQFYFVNNLRDFIGVKGFKITSNETQLNKYYLLFIFVFLIGVYRLFKIKKIDSFLLLLFIAGVSSIIGLFQKNINNGNFYLLIPFIAILTSILLKEFMLWAKKKNKKIFIDSCLRNNNKP